MRIVQVFHRILLSVDLDDDSSWRKPLPVALECCKAFGATLHIVTVMPEFRFPVVGSHFPADFETQAHAELEAELERFVDAHVPADVSATHAVLAGGPVYERILGAARELGSDLVVIAAHRPDLKDFLLGPNASRVVRHASQSVLVVRE